VSHGSGAAGAPATDGSVVVWADDRGGDYDIYAKDLESGREWTVYAGVGDQTDPAVCAGQVFWVDRSGDAATVWTADPESGVAVQVSDGAADQVAAGDHLVAWTDRSGADANIVACDPGSGDSWTVCDAPGDQVSAAVSGDLIAWQDYRNGDAADIYAGDPWGGDEVAICVAAGDQTDPAVYGTVVLCADDRAGDSDIYGADAAELRWSGSDAGRKALAARRCETRLEFIVCDAAGDQVQPAVGGPMAYWTDLSNGGDQADVIGRDLTWGDPFAIADGDGAQSAPATADHGGLIVWNDASGDVPLVAAGRLSWQDGDDGDEPGPVEEWTTDDVVTLFLSVFADRGVFDEVRFAVDDGAFGDWQWLDDTETVQLPSHDGAHTIHTQLANTGLEAGTAGSEGDPLEIDAGTTLHRRGPVTVAPHPVVVTMGAVAQFEMRVRDNLSPTADVKLRSKDHAGKAVKVVRLGQRPTGKLIGRKWQARLRRGHYTYRVMATDLAGNPPRTPSVSAASRPSVQGLAQLPPGPGVLLAHDPAVDAADARVPLEHHLQFGVDGRGVGKESDVPGAVPTIRQAELGRGAARLARLVSRADPLDVGPHQVGGRGAAPLASVEAYAHDDLARRHLGLGEVEDAVHPLRRRQGAGSRPGARVVVGHHAELVDLPAEGLPVLCSRTVPAAGLARLGVHVDGDQAVVVVQSPGELGDELRVTPALRGADRFPVDVHAVHPVLAAPGGDRRRVATAALRTGEDRGRDRRVEAVGRLVVVGERDEDMAVLAARQADEGGVVLGRREAAVAARLQPVDAHLVDSPGVDGAPQRGPVAEGPGADEVGAVRPCLVHRTRDHERDGNGAEAGEDDDQQGRRAVPAP
jgi:beta propeller repeat protein